VELRATAVAVEATRGEEEGSRGVEAAAAEAMAAAEEGTPPRKRRAVFASIPLLRWVA